MKLLNVHLTVRGSNDDNGTIHVGSTSDHVLNVISVTRAVDVGIVTAFGLELDVGSRDSDTTLALLRGLVNGAIVEEVGKALLSLTLGDSGGESGLEVFCQWSSYRTRSRRLSNCCRTLP